MAIGAQFPNCNAQNVVSHWTVGLQCYTCSSVLDPECVSSPGLVGAGVSECQEPNDEFCYINRLEQEEEGGGEGSHHGRRRSGWQKL